MSKIIIKGQNKLTGTIEVGGMKNCAVALLPAAILSEEPVTIANIPRITDVDNIEHILNYLNVKTKYKESIFTIDTKEMQNKKIAEEYSSKLRASYYFMGALLAKFKKVEISFPGGCDLGPRPIDIHLKGFKALGANITKNENDYLIEAEKLEGANIYLDFPSVGATINIMIAATMAKGTTIIDNCAKEPEIANVATMLNTMGAKIRGAGTNTIKITGVEHLKGCFHETIPDRIEASTYMIIASLIGKNLKIANIIPEHLEALTLKLEETGVEIEEGYDYFIINAPEKLKPIKIKTLVYPGFVTDMGQITETLMTQCNGTSSLTETIYQKRFGNIEYLKKMGANTEIKGNTVKIKGPTKLKGKTVEATELRAGASLVIAGLIAEGTTTIETANHVLRGYEKLEQKLKQLGADIKVEN